MSDEDQRYIETREGVWDSSAGEYVTGPNVKPSDGGPAFPRSRDSWPDPDNPALADISDEQDGMSLREYFAAQALPAMIAKTSPGTGVPTYLSRAVADGCVAYADALLERLGLADVPVADGE